MEAVAVEVLEKEINHTLNLTSDFNMCTVELKAAGASWGVSNVRISTTEPSDINYFKLKMAVNEYVQRAFGERVVSEGCGV